MSKKKSPALSDLLEIALAGEYVYAADLPDAADRAAVSAEAGKRKREKIEKLRAQGN